MWLFSGCWPWLPYTPLYQPLPSAAFSGLGVDLHSLGVLGPLQMFFTRGRYRQWRFALVSFYVFTKLWWVQIVLTKCIDEEDSNNNDRNLYFEGEDDRRWVWRSSSASCHSLALSSRGLDQEVGFHQKDGTYQLIHQPGDFHENDKIFQSIHKPQSPAWLGLDRGQLWQLDSFLTSGLRHILPHCLVTISTILINYDQLHFYPV